MRRSGFSTCIWFSLLWRAGVFGVTAVSAFQVVPAMAMVDASAGRDGDFTLIAVGDLIYTQPVLAAMRRNSPDLLAILHSGSVTFGNLEENILDLTEFHGYPQAESGGSWLLAPPPAAADLKEMGFGILSRANNHGTDWGVEGLLATDRLLDTLGLVHAGTGTSRATAAAPAFLDDASGRVALVSVTTTFSSMTPAQDGTDLVAARPGANVLRTTRIVHLSPEKAVVLAGIANALPKRDQEPMSGTGRVSFLGNVYQSDPAAGDRVTYTYDVDGSDRALSLSAVARAAKEAQVTVMSVHSHQSVGLGTPGSSLDQETPDFLKSLAHDAIDAGASAFVAHGPHILRGIEIYKGRPIFYSLGNFFFMEDQLSPLPRDFFEKMHFEPGEKKTAEVMNISRERRFNDVKYFESAVARSHFRNGRLVRLELYPVVLGFDRSDGTRGVPRMADAESSQKILIRLQELSAVFGTKIKIEGGVGIVVPQ